MASSPERPIPKLLLPPGPSVCSIVINPDRRKIEDPDVSTGFQRPSPIFYDALSVRNAVFGIEQNCSAAEEIDAEDALSWHWVIYAKDDQGQEGPVATIRLTPAQAHADTDDEKSIGGPNYKGSNAWDHKEPYVKLGRLANLKEFRGRSYGNLLAETALKYAEHHVGDMIKDQELGDWHGLVLIHAQRRMERWYGRLGFQTDMGLGTWLEEGIEHVGMWKRVDVP
ncbi:hypothetical protein ACLMJK_002518 [Lecanora helva]